MTREQQDLAWACLTATQRIICRGMYKTSCDGNIEFILDELFGGHNLTSDTEPEEMLMIERSKVQHLYEEQRKFRDEKDSTAWKDYEVREVILTALRELFGDKCLPDKEESTDEILNALKHYRNTATPHQKVNDLTKLEVECLSGEEQPKPKFNIGQKVIKLNGSIRKISDRKYTPKGYKYFFEGFDYADYSFEQGMEPYTEKYKDNMEEKELNLCELLKGCEGEKFFNPNYGVVTLVGIEKNLMMFNTSEGGSLTPPMIYQLHTGFIPYYPTKELFLKYPLDAYSAWMEWKEARSPKQWRAEEGKIYWWIDDELLAHECIEYYERDNNANYEVGNYFRTEEEAKQAAKVVREALQKFHEHNLKK